MQQYAAAAGARGCHGQLCSAPPSLNWHQQHVLPQLTCTLQGTAPRHQPAAKLTARRAAAFSLAKSNLNSARSELSSAHLKLNLAHFKHFSTVRARLSTFRAALCTTHHHDRAAWTRSCCLASCTYMFSCITLCSHLDPAVSALSGSLQARLTKASRASPDPYATATPCQSAGCSSTGALTVFDGRRVLLWSQPHTMQRKYGP